MSEAAAAHKFATATTAIRYASGFTEHPFRIEGAANTADVDRHKSVVHPSGCAIDAMPVPLRWKHGTADIGAVYWARKTPHQLWIRAAIDEAESGFWSDMASGAQYRLSVCFDPLSDPQTDRYGVKHYHRWRLREISLCRDDAANPQAFCWTLPQSKTVSLLKGINVSGLQPWF